MAMKTPREAARETQTLTQRDVGSLEAVVPELAAKPAEPPQPPPSIGRVVHYKLAVRDVMMIRDLNTKHLQGCNPHEEGQVLPAEIVRVWGPDASAAVNLKVKVDGNVPDLWVTSAVRGDGNGQWNWPAWV